MAMISNLSGTEAEILLSENTSTCVNGYLDYRGEPIYRCNSGGWRSASFIIAVEVAEKCAFFGILCNLISYLTGPLDQSTATAAANVNAWSGTAALLPLLGAFLADSFLGRYHASLLSSFIHILGLGLLTLSALLFSLSNSDCQNEDSTKSSCSTPLIQKIIFFFSLYLVAFGQGCGRPCVQAFGADQFDERNPKESKAKSSFFNWLFFSTSTGIILAISVLTYIEDNLNWTVAFAILFAVMAFAMVVFMLGTKTYRYSAKRNNEQNPFARIGRVFVAAFKNWKTTSSNDLVMPCESEEAPQILPQQSSQQFKFLDKALLATSSENGKLCSVTDVEEAKALLRLIPIWITLMPYAIVYAQPNTLFTKQGATMDRTFFPGMQIPAASLQLFIPVTIVLFVPIYDRIFISITRSLTHTPSGITMLQRIGTGMVLLVSCMVVAGFVEMKRLKIAEESGLIDKPNLTVPMSVWWLVPQYVLLGLSNVFTTIGLQEFFYDQAPRELRSVGLSLYLTIFGVGSFLSSFLVSTINEIASASGGISWFANNLNEAHLDYFYWLLVGLNVVGFAAYFCFAKSYIYI